MSSISVHGVVTAKRLRVSSVVAPKVATAGKRRRLKLARRKAVSTSGY